MKRKIKLLIDILDDPYSHYLETQLIDRIRAELEEIKPIIREGDYLTYNCSESFVALINSTRKTNATFGMNDAVDCYDILDEIRYKNYGTHQAEFSTVDEVFETVQDAMRQFDGKLILSLGENPTVLECNQKNFKIFHLEKRVHPNGDVAIHNVTIIQEGSIVYQDGDFAMLLESNVDPDVYDHVYKSFYS